MQYIAIIALTEASSDFCVQDPGETCEEGQGGAASPGLETALLHSAPRANQAGLLL